MEGLNLGGMIELEDSVGFQGGNLVINGSQQDIKSLMNETLYNFDKQKFLAKVTNFELSDDMKYFINEYDGIFQERNCFIWKFLGYIYRETEVTLSTVDKKYIDSITDCKIITSMLCVAIDDIAEVHKDERLLKVMVKILRNDSSEYDLIDNEKISLVKRLWDYLLKELQ